jgi:alginate O-acetyltransferase complex protein AlgI
MAWLDFYSLVILAFISTIIYIIIKKKINLNKYIYLLSILLIALLILIKDYRFILDKESVYVPLGVSYYFFRLISFLIEYSKRPTDLSNVGFVEYFSWVFFFPVFLAGPILRFHDFKALDVSYHNTRKNRYYGKLIASIVLKIVIVDFILYNVTYTSLYNIINVKFSDANYLNNQFLNLPYLSLFSFSAFLHAYFDLMIYTEISKAFAGILGFTNVDNFNRPFLSSNISQFWQNWHMSLSHWTRDYIFFPLLIKTKKTWISTYASMFILGIWHSATPNWIVWALFHATAINCYGLWRKTPLFRFIAAHHAGAIALRITGNLFTIYFVSLVFCFVALHDMQFTIRLFIRCF